MTPTIATKTLSSGAVMPMIGLGVFQSEPGAETYNAVLSALKLGYRHIDTAQYYENEADVGRAVRDSGVPREQVFVTTKLVLDSWSYNKAMNAAKSSNEKLGLGYIDLYLLHAPFAPEHREDAWRAVEDLHEQGILKDIGVSNFSEAHLEKLFKTARVKPCVNQVELHPWLMRSSLVKFCQDHDIILQAYSPLARATKMEDPTLVAIAKEVGASPAQVLIAFSLANGFVALPKSVHAERQLSNLEAATIKLTPAQVERLTSPDSYLPTALWDPVKQHAV
ncbi:Putative aldehyde reductase [Phytophthora palmivora]|uniref:Aldehyde reductase n=1 Tax=Phytophthora palmivora TaxID=4796 RepID=A0A2P4Y105_9STRA|nr:Putative aldehyde reductase [Phytophthora palmivora]